MSGTANGFKLIGLSGSIHKHSTNTVILRTLADKCAHHLEILSLDDIPLYNEDLEKEAVPASVVAPKKAIEACDGLILCCPEYNHGMSGVLKNALDWASRPAFASPLLGKPCLLMSSSYSYVGGARAHAQMQATMAASLARVVTRPQVVIANIAEKIQDGELVDEATIAFCLAAIDDLVKDIRVFALAG
jgi:chromate reductase, NAD(P)H dehydrogenase (quinone)